MILAIRRRKKIIMAVFAGVAGAGLCVYLAFQGKAILESLEGFVEDRLGKAFNAEVAIDSIRTNIIGPTVLKGFKLTKEASGEDTPFIFKSDKVTIYNNIIKIAAEKLLKKDALAKKDIVFKIENGSLYKGNAALLKNIFGYGKIQDNNFIFDDISGKCYNFPISIYGKVSGDTSMLDLNIRSASDAFRSKIHLSNHLLTPHMVAIIESDNGHKLYFSGDFDIKPGESVSLENAMFGNTVLARAKWDILKKKVYAELKKRHLPDEPSLTKDVVCLAVEIKHDAAEGSIFFNHLSVGKFDLQSQLDFELAFTGDNRQAGPANGGANGKIKTSGTILDYKPFSELDGEFSIEGNTLKISGLRLGSDYNLRGFVNLYYPYEMDLTLDIRDSSLSRLFLVSDADSAGKISGRISGQVKTSGPVNNLVTTAKIECGKGNLGNLDYESMNVNLSGVGSVLKVADSRILRKEGYIELSGDADLKQLWSQRPLKGLDWSCGNEAIVWEGWDIVKQTNSQELEMKKGIGSQKEFMVTFRSYLNDEQSWQDSQGPKQNEAVGVEYNLDEAKRVKMQLKNNEEVFSLEHKLKF